jgi:hypothetical protein
MMESESTELRRKTLKQELDMLETAFSETIGPEGPFNNYADCFVPPGHAGACALTYSNKDGTHWIILPSREDAIATAVGACRYYIGGYSSVAVYPVSAAPTEAEIYSTGIRWLFPEAYVDDEESAPPAVAEIINPLCERSLNASQCTRTN